MAIRMKESQERFANLKLKFSPIKHEKASTVGRTMSKSVSEKRLHRNNSFRTAIGEIDTKNETLSNVFASTGQPLGNRLQKRTLPIESTIQRSLSRQDDSNNFKRPCDPGDSSLFISKSFSMNSIQKGDTEDTSAVSIEKKRKLMQSSTNSLSNLGNASFFDLRVKSQQSLLYIFLV